MTNEIYTDISKEDLRRAQKIMLYIMKKIHAVCVKHNIKYWLDYGTLLGAIRHDGFIPWDDDLDICMMREDFEKFNKVAQSEFGDEFFWQTPETDPALCYEYGKVRLNGTLWQETVWMRTAKLKNNGLFIDVFPIDPFPVKRIQQVPIALLCDKVFNRIIDYKIFKKSSPNFIKRTVQKILAVFIPVSMVYRWRKKIVLSLQKHKNNSSYVSKVTMDTMRDICDKSLFDELILHKFEDTEFYIPACYDKRLKLLFNNYMQLPPEDKRYGHHGIFKYDFGKYGNL